MLTICEEEKGLGLQEGWVKGKSKVRAQEGMCNDPLHVTEEERLSPEDRPEEVDR